MNFKYSFSLADPHFANCMCWIPKLEEKLLQSSKFPHNISDGFTQIKFYFNTSQGEKSNMKFTVSQYFDIYWPNSGHFQFEFDMTTLNVLK